MKVITTRSEMRNFIREQRTDIALVPTMGALHQGHLELVRKGRELADIVVVSIFVNPLQFGVHEDFGKYPRTLEADLIKLNGLTAAVFVPCVKEILNAKNHSEIEVCAPEIGRILEGQSRPNHFNGVLTIVTKLFNIVQPDYAIFGQKDAQQLALIRKMVTELNFPIIIEKVETVRDPDGLAMSSRNQYLSAEERIEARRLAKALEIAKTKSLLGLTLNEIIREARTAFSDAPQLTILDYLEIVDIEDFTPIKSDESIEKAMVVIAAWIGKTRLIDNTIIHFI